MQVEPEEEVFGSSVLVAKFECEECGISMNYVFEKKVNEE